MPLQDRLALERRARLLAWGGNGWHVVEFAVAIVAGVVAASPALIGFSLDSLIELAAGFVIVWLYRLTSGQADERRAQRLVAATYLLLVVFIVSESAYTLTGGGHPKVSWVGIGLAAFTAPTMPLLALAKRRVGHKLGSSATVSWWGYLRMRSRAGGGPTQPRRSRSQRWRRRKDSTVGVARAATAAEQRRDARTRFRLLKLRIESCGLRVREARVSLRSKSDDPLFSK
jgi:hypothetical protein